jgi:dihydrolipoamide dehydrogenase
MSNQFDLIVIGAGPGGYVAAIRAAQLGKNVAIIEREPALGGTCLRVGCIPSKALLESSEKYHEAKSTFEEHGIDASVKLDLAKMLARKDKVVNELTGGVAYLMKKNKITHIAGEAKIIAPGQVSVGEQTVEAAAILIATGSKSAPLPGVEVDGENVVTSTEALNFESVPEHLVVIGAGYIGLELGSVWKRLGSNVTVVEYLDRILPTMDAEIAKDAQRILKKQGLNFQLSSKVLSAKAVKRGKKIQCVVECEGKEPIVADKVLLAVGRIPNTDNLGLEALQIATERGRITVDENYQTNVAGIYAIGDVIAGPMLAHKASEEGVACVEKLYTGYGHVNYNTIPGVGYTNPEIASVGKTEEQLKEAGIEYRKGTFPFSAIGRAKALGQTEGKVKILADAKTDSVLGVHIVGPRAGDLIAEAVAAMEFGASSEDIARTCHAHPTLAEAVHEAALAVDGRAIHF